MVEHSELQSAPVLVGLTCDCCGTRHDDVIERQEFLRWKDVAGYGARHFSDGDALSLDLCQDCVDRLLRPWVRVVPGC